MMTTPFYIYLMLTERCNYKCGFCIRRNISHPQKESSTSIIMAALDILSNEYPNAILVLTGGEPTLHPDFEDILHVAVKKFKQVQITSNGSFGQDIAVMMLPLLKKNLFLQMSIDGPQELHDSIRGVGAFSRIIQNLSLLKDAWNHIGLAATVPPQNYEEIKLLAQQLNGQKFQSLKVVSVVDYTDSFLKNFSNKKWNHFVDEMLLICNYNLIIQKILDFELMDEFIENYADVKPLTNCGRGKQQIYINPNMDVLTCTCQSKILGNIVTDDFASLKERIAQSGYITPSPESVCYSCKYKSLCNGGCPGYSTHFWGKPNMGDIRCPIVKEHYLKLRTNKSFES